MGKNALITAIDALTTMNTKLVEALTKAQADFRETQQNYVNMLPFIMKHVLNQDRDDKKEPEIEEKKKE